MIETPKKNKGTFINRGAAAVLKKKWHPHFRMFPLYDGVAALVVDSLYFVCLFVYIWLNSSETESNS